MMKKSFFAFLVLFIISTFAFAAGGFNLNTNPEVMKAGTDGNFGKDNTYVLFGYWPQSVKSSNVSINEKGTVKINDWDCYKGDDGFYYVKQKAISDNGGYFSDYRNIKNNTEYYFKLEPIKWCVLDENYQGGYLVMAEDILDMQRFDIGSNNYEESQIRSYLNDEFLNKAFSSESIKNINTVIVDNSAESAADYNNTLGIATNILCENTKDKVFLLSEKEITGEYFDYNGVNSTILSRRRESADYALAKKGTANSWWLRSPFDDMFGSDAHYVTSYGETDNIEKVHKKNGVVPAIVISRDCFPTNAVSNLTLTSNHNIVDLQWKNPDDDRLSKVIISGLGAKDIELDADSNSFMSNKSEGLEFNKEYNVTIYAVSKNNLKSEGVKTSFKLKDLPPENVINPKITSENNVALFTWTNPSDIDFEKVIISCPDFGNIEVNGTPGDNNSCKLYSCINGKSYSIDINAIDKAGNKSSGFNLKFFMSNDVPVTMKTGTDGSYGTKGTYVEFGFWPQTLKADNVTIDTSKTETANGWTCYKGSDGFLYVKTIANPFQSSSKFDNGTRIVKGNEYYFKLEPIKWRAAIDNYQGGKLLVSENILIGKRYDDTSSNYKNSEIRAWLNSDFINKAFSKESIDKIKTVTVDNSVASTAYGRNDYVCENTKDKIFLLSYDEITNRNYGFGGSGHEKERIRMTTDYSRATGAFLNNYTKYGSWFLRSPSHTDSKSVCHIPSDGVNYENMFVYSKSEGIVPALSISF